MRIDVVVVHTSSGFLQHFLIWAFFPGLKGLRQLLCDAIHDKALLIYMMPLFLHYYNVHCRNRPPSSKCPSRRRRRRSTQHIANLPGPLLCASLSPISRSNFVGHHLIQRVQAFFKRLGSCRLIGGEKSLVIREPIILHH